jgi:calcineurin-like phosphoesterase family protein
VLKSWTTWFSSDIHFNHAKAIEFSNRPFTDIEDMNEKIIENWNKVVKPEDLGILVGDVFLYSNAEQMKSILSRMNGRLILVRGNHDNTPRKMMNAGFLLCVEELKMPIAGEMVTISHYPFAVSEWKYKKRLWVNKIKRMLGIKLTRYVEKYHTKRPKDKGQFLIHGHTHDKAKVRGRQIHVGVDAWDYQPVNIQEISNIIQKIKQDEKS